LAAACRVLGCSTRRAGCAPGWRSTTTNQTCAPQQCYPGLLGDFVLLRADGILSPMTIGASLLLSARCVLRAIWELTCYALRFHGALLLPRARLAARVVVAESQLAVELNGSGRGKRRRRQFAPAFRTLWVLQSLVSDCETTLQAPEDSAMWLVNRGLETAAPERT